VEEAPARGTPLVRDVEPVLASVARDVLGAEGSLGALAQRRRSDASERLECRRVATGVRGQVDGKPGCVCPLRAADVRMVDERRTRVAEGHQLRSDAIGYARVRDLGVRS